MYVSVCDVCVHVTVCFKMPVHVDVDVKKALSCGYYCFLFSCMFVFLFCLFLFLLSLIMRFFQLWSKSFVSLSVLYKLILWPGTFF